MNFDVYLWTESVSFIDTQLDFLWNKQVIYNVYL